MAADICESLAFSRATGCNLVVLVYPPPVGTSMVFEKA